MGKDRRPEASMVIPQMLGNSPHKPRAASLQRKLETVDDLLVGLARAQHPTVAWWWGVRTIAGIKCAWCYVCNKVIVEGALNVGITEAQSDEVDGHKRGHWEDAAQVMTDRPPF